MIRISVNRFTICQLGLSIALTVAGWGLGLNVSSAEAESAVSKKTPAAASSPSDDSSTDSLQNQISNLDIQIQKLREQSWELQEKTRAKLQEQLEIMKTQRDTLIPRRLAFF